MSGQFFHTAPRIFSSSSDYQSDKVRCWWTVFICQQSGFFVSANVATLLANEANLLAKKTTLLAKNCPLRRVLRVLTRLLYPQHLHGIWSGLMPYRLPFDTLGEYSEPWLQQTRISLSWTWGRNAVKKKQSPPFLWTRAGKNIARIAKSCTENTVVEVSSCLY